MNTDGTRKDARSLHCSELPAISSLHFISEANLDISASVMPHHLGPLHKQYSLSRPICMSTTLSSKLVRIAMLQQTSHTSHLQFRLRSPFPALDPLTNPNSSIPSSISFSHKPQQKSQGGNGPWPVIHFPRTAREMEHALLVSKIDQTQL